MCWNKKAENKDLWKNEGKERDNVSRE